MLKSFFLNLLFPIECLGCHREGSWLCDACFKKLNFGSDEKKHHLAIPDLDKIFIAGDYDDQLLATAIKKFKYNFVSSLGPILARFLIIFWSGQKLLNERLLISANELANQNSGLSSPPLVVPIPLSKKRQRWRGFNQAEILARELSAHFSYDLNLNLKRVKHKKPQTELSELERLNNVHGIFVWTGANLNNQTIILIDDVVTTGATLNEVARILKAAGAGQVYGLVLAKG
jgi:competence protein ComFC